jgi:hypothetical protein
MELHWHDCKNQRRTISCEMSLRPLPCVYLPGDAHRASNSRMKRLLRALQLGTCGDLRRGHLAKGGWAFALYTLITLPTPQRCQSMIHSRGLTARQCSVQSESTQELASSRLHFLQKGRMSKVVSLMEAFRMKRCFGIFRGRWCPDPKHVSYAFLCFVLLGEC